VLWYKPRHLLLAIYDSQLADTRSTRANPPFSSLTCLPPPLRLCARPPRATGSTRDAARACAGPRISSPGGFARGVPAGNSAPDTWRTSACLHRTGSDRVEGGRSSPTPGIRHTTRRHADHGSRFGASRKRSSTRVPAAGWQSSYCRSVSSAQTQMMNARL
jgi:hypothetical protein